jgi:hypothetical protein
MRHAAPLIAFALLVASAPARAEDAAAPPDVVRTRDGGMMRGTIVEKVPDDHVEILLINGQTRSLKMRDVIYAGPAAGDVGAVPPPPALPPPPPSWTPPTWTPPDPVANTAVDLGVARLELKSDQQGLTFHRKSGSSNGVGLGWATGKNGGPIAMGFTADHFERLCTAPCTLDIAPGTYRLGLSLDDGRVVPAQTALDLRGRVRLEGTYVSNAGLRTAGWIIFGAGSLLGGVVALQTQDNCNTGITGFCSTEFPYLIPGLVVMAVSELAGLIMGLQPDRAEVQAMPSR